MLYIQKDPRGSKSESRRAKGAYFRPKVQAAKSPTNIELTIFLLQDYGLDDSPEEKPKKKKENRVKLSSPAVAKK